MKQHTVIEGESLANIACVCYGDVRGVFWLLADNPALRSVADRLTPGQLLTIRAGAINPRVASYLQDFAPIATIENADDMPGGVGWWALEEYIVQLDPNEIGRAHV